MKDIYFLLRLPCALYHQSFFKKNFSQKYICIILLIFLIIKVGVQKLNILVYMFKIMLVLLIFQ